MGDKNLLTIDDVPVLLIGYNRPELLKKRIYELSDMPIKHLYISIDGGDSSHTDKMNLVITKASVIFKDLHTLEIHHNRKNLGLVKDTVVLTLKPDGILGPNINVIHEFQSDFCTSLVLATQDADKKALDYLDKTYNLKWL